MSVRGKMEDHAEPRALNNVSDRSAKCAFPVIERYAVLRQTESPCCASTVPRSNIWQIIKELSGRRSVQQARELQFKTQIAGSGAFPRAAGNGLETECKTVHKL